MSTQTVIAVGILLLAVVGIVAYSFWPSPAATHRTATTQGIATTPGIATTQEVTTAPAGTLDTRTIMMIVVSVIVMAAALYVVLSKRYDDATQKWAFGAVGTVIGFWLKQ